MAAAAASLAPACWAAASGPAAAGAGAGAAGVSAAAAPPASSRACTSRATVSAAPGCAKKPLSCFRKSRAAARKACGSEPTSLYTCHGRAQRWNQRWRRGAGGWYGGAAGACARCIGNRRREPVEGAAVPPSPGSACCRQRCRSPQSCWVGTGAWAAAASLGAAGVRRRGELQRRRAGYLQQGASTLG